MPMTPTHLPVAFDATPDGRPASYRCVRCTRHWPADTTPPTTCKENSTR